jgi:hypothetical protein
LPSFGQAKEKKKSISGRERGPKAVIRPTDLFGVKKVKTEAFYSFIL